MNERTNEIETTFCYICGEEFQRTNTRGKVPKYCSDKCRKAAAKISEMKYRASIKDRPKPEYKKPKHTLTDVIAECKAQGMSYADWQKAKTLKMLEGKNGKRNESRKA